MEVNSWRKCSLEGGSSREIWSQGWRLDGGGGVIGWPSSASRWWKDLVSLAKGEEVDWFNVEVERRVGNGGTTSFWNVVWRGEVAFRDKYPRLFSISNNQEVKVSDLWIHNENGGSWGFSWRRELFVWENNLLLELLEDLDGFVWRLGVDFWAWKLEGENLFSVKSLYSKLIGRGLGVELKPEGERRVFRHI